MKMMKTAIVTASVLASASIFAQSAGVNAGASAQVNVQPGGLVSGVAIQSKILHIL
ncbi:putative signal peptide-containing protein [Acinetobacter baumannii]|nr:putative signal peptide-containing protein [Acinetobacter baumannii]